MRVGLNYNIILGSSPLSFIFEETAYDSTMGLVSNIVLQEGERM